MRHTETGKVASEAPGIVREPITAETIFALTDQGRRELGMRPEADRQTSTAQQTYEKAERPQPEWVRGICPQCGDHVVSNAYWVGGKGWVILWECWSSLGQTPTCKYRRVL